jgi:hypothetical protein
MKVTLVDKNNEVVHFFRPTPEEREAISGVGILKYGDIYYNFAFAVSSPDEMVFCESEVWEF